jgi:diacylglycerol O-acyltransferase
MSAGRTLPRTVLVVGAAGGVGESVARLLCSQGWRVIGTCRTATQGQTLLKRGACHQVLRMDLADADSITRAFDQLASQEVTELDALVNCAAITHAGPLEAESIEELRKLFEVNLFAALRVVQLALPFLRAARGCIALIGSSSGAIGLPMLGAYSSSKFALEGMTDALRREMAGQGVPVSLIIPGGIRTPMTEGQRQSADAGLAALDAHLRRRYASLYQQHSQLLLTADRLAVAPERVAEDVLKALTDRNPKPRYFCGIDQQALRVAARLLPDTVWDELLPALVDISAGRWPERRPEQQAPEESSMKQLSSFDALMVFAESSRTPMHVSPFFIYDVSTARNGFVRFKDILRVFEERLSQAPILRQKLVRVPLDLDDPYWADDPDFDIEQHIRHVALPKPGDRRQLSILLARLTAYPMDLSRPAWDAFVIEGLDHVDGVPPGSFGLLLRIHHAAIDGHSGHAVLRAIHDLSATAKSPASAEAREPVQVPTTAQMLTRAYLKLWTKPSKIAKVLVDVVPAMNRVKAVKRENPNEQRPVPKTRFSAKVSSQRVVSLITFDMEGLRAAREVVEGATINDAVMTVVSGAMRRYLDAKGELPTQSMTSIMPMNVRTEAERDKPGNVVSLASLNLHSDIADPLERLRAIHASAFFSKTYHNAVGARVMSNVAESIPAGITSLGARVAGAAGLIDKLPGNTIVTNVPGPQQPLYLAGAKVVEFHAVGALLDGLGLFHAVNSYCGRIAITVLADRRMMPDPAFYEQCVRESYAELRAATETVRPSAERRGASKAKPGSRVSPRTTRAPEVGNAAAAPRRRVSSAGAARKVRHA